MKTENELKMCEKEIALGFERYDFQKALKYARRRLDILQQRLPKGHPDFVKAHSQIAWAYCNLSDYDKALVHFTHAHLTAGQVYPKDHPEMAVSYANVGMIHCHLGQYEEGMAHYLHARNIYLKKLGRFVNNTKIAMLYHNMAGALWHEGKCKQALAYCKRALGMLRVGFHIDHVTEALVHNAMGMLYHHLFQYGQAIKHYYISLEIFNRYISPNSLEIADVHANLGKAYESLEQRDEAMIHHTAAMKIREKRLSAKHPDTLRSYNDMGSMHMELGQYEDALAYFKKELHEKEKMFSSGHKAVADVLGSLGQVYASLGHQQEALSHYFQALQIYEAQGLAGQPLTGTLHNNIAAVYAESGQYEQALHHYLKALDIICAHSAPDQLSIAYLHNNIGVAYGNAGQYEKAAAHHTKALRIIKRSKPATHSRIDMAYNQLGQDYYHRGQKRKMLPCVKALLKRLPGAYKSIMSAADDTYRRSVVQALKSCLFFLFAADFTYKKISNPRALYGLLLQTKDIFAEVELTVRAYHFSKEESAYRDILQKIESKTAQYNHLILVKSAKKRAAVRLRQEIQELTLSLSPFIKKIDFATHMKGLTPKAVMANLRQGCALLEFGWFYYKKPEADTQSSGASRGMYYAFLLCKHRITLHYFTEPDSVIHEMIYRVRERIIKAENRGASLDACEELAALYKRLIEPFGEYLSGIRHLYIAPDGELYKLPFELLPNERGETLSDRFSISYLSSGRDLARSGLRNQSFKGYSRAAIVANPSYDLPEGALPLTPAARRRPSAQPGKAQSRDVGTLKSFTPLPFAMLEANALDKVFKGEKKKLYQSDAVKDALRQIGPADIIHIVTHGFFLEQAKPLPDNKALSPQDRKQAYLRSEDPLLRCGLAFAGVNNWLDPKKRNPPDSFGDGILNAREILSLNLPDTDLIVLSACETGLGAVRNGDGIHGFRRAFELVGVRTLICTLWSVSDEASAILMERFYQNLLERGMDKLDALSEAKNYVREMTVQQAIDYFYENGYTENADTLRAACDFPEELEEKRYAHPYYWAGYILQGNDRQHLPNAY